jgi:putative lipoic acid-binding regulatory protein
MALSKFPSADAEEWWDNFKKLLDESNEWPVEYIFKFIAPKENMGDLKAVFVGHEIDIKASSKGSYHSITSRIQVASSEEVVDVYQRAGAIEGVISL